MKRFGLTIVLLLSSISIAHALSVGEIKVHSSFGEPLDAEIDIPAYTEQEINELFVSIAPASVFEERGLEFAPSVTNLRFKIRRRSDASPYITVRTVEPLEELMLSFIAEFTWPNGHLVKEYHLLLTPASLVDGEHSSGESLLDKAPTPPQIIEPETREVVAETVVVDEVEQEIPRRGLPDPQLKDLGNGQWSYGPVRPGESLSSIAEKFEAMTSMNIEERMQVLFRLNPQAFGNNNINQLRAGYILRFRDAPELATPQSGAGPDYMDDMENAGNERRGKATSTSPIKNDLETLVELRSQLDQTREKVIEYRTTNAELRNRLTELEQEVSTRARELGIEPQL